MINPMRSNNVRMMGMMSGIDTQSIVDATIRMHQFRIDNVTRNRTLIQWRQENHSSIRNEVSNIRQNFLSVLGNNSMMNRNVFNSTTSAITNNASNAVTVRTNANSPTGSFQINSVQQLARGASLNTAASVSNTANGFDMNVRLGNMQFTDGKQINWSETAVLNVGGEDVRLVRDVRGEATSWTAQVMNSDGQWAERADLKVSVTDGVITIENGANASRSVMFNSATGVFSENVADTFSANIRVGANYIGVTWNGDELTTTRGSAEINDDGTVTITNGNISETFAWDAINNTFTTTPPEDDDGSYEPIVHQLDQVTRNVTNISRDAIFTINGVDIAMNSNDTLSQFINRVNSSDAGVVMGYDRLSDSFSISARTGSAINPAETGLAIDDNGSGFLGLIRGDVAPNEDMFLTGQQAIVYINGERIYSNTNNVDFRGVNITLNAVTDAGASAIGVSLVRDAQPAINAIRGFIDVYNSLIARLEGMLNERRTSSQTAHRPLTDEERSHLTEREAEEWDRVARIGIMRSDRDIENMVNNLRNSFFSQIEGAGMSASQLGLTTGRWQREGGTGGQIMINEDRLRTALEENPSQVADVFIGMATDSDGTTRGVGLLHRIDSIMNDYLRNTQRTTMPAMEESLRRINDQVERMERRMWADEDRLHRQFSAMEAAMARLNSQADWFASMMGAF